MFLLAHAFALFRVTCIHTDASALTLARSLCLSRTRMLSLSLALTTPTIEELSRTRTRLLVLPHSSPPPSPPPAVPADSIVKGLCRRILIGEGTQMLRLPLHRQLRPPLPVLFVPAHAAVQRLSRHRRSFLTFHRCPPPPPLLFPNRIIPIASRVVAVAVAQASAPPTRPSTPTSTSTPRHTNAARPPGRPHGREKSRWSITPRQRRRRGRR